MSTARARAAAAVRPGGAVIVDLPAGHLDDPPGRAGLAALLAAVLNEPRCGGAAARAAAEGWRTRHHLDDHSSSFAYWSPRPADLASVVHDLRGTRLPAGPAGEDLLARLRARLAAADAGHGAPLLALVRRQLERASWGSVGDERAGGAGGATTRGTAAGVTPADLARSVDLLVSRAQVYDATTAPDGGHRPSPGPVRLADGDAPRWHGGLDLAVRADSDARVAVRLPVQAPPPGVLDLLVEVLGNGTDGRLHRELRHRHHLAYGFTAACARQHGLTSISATATVAPQHAAAALRVLTAALRRLADGAGSEETRSARWRCRAGLLAELDGPYGPADELRRHALGQRGIRERLAAVADLDVLPGLSFTPLPPAVAAVGPFEEHHRRQLAAAYEEIR
ncbi:insulinase family protein [Streptomyces sp. 1331.2]|uniref:insulinase family protein n=1 Tax=Streptomyces sp. 1331.2 TaxID=1938835 RepID=UPI000BCBCC78|nr:insulinase family protein [Streptomyces sp. 1331.2]SOB82815.1 Peptidase M16 inactive domain-containing protein [Streptomyces sp. 1331.2]